MRYVSYPADILHHWALGGILYTGATSYDCYPQGAASVTVTAGALSWQDGAAATLVAASGIAAPYYLTHLAHVDSAATGSAQFTLSTTSAQNTRQVFHRLRYSTSSYMDVTPLIPYRTDANDATTITAGAENPSLALKAYLEVLKTYPQPVPDLMRIDPTAASAIIPTTPAGTNIVAAAGAWNYTASPTQLIAATATAILIYAVTISSASAGDAQVSYMTGGAGVEVEFAVFGIPRAAGTATLAVTYVLPFPIYVPTGTRIAARSRSSAGGTTHQAGYTYVPLPLF